jgi:multidrug resistance efflux pump
MWNNQNIPMPLKRRWLRFCYRGMPILGFAVCMALMLWLWQRQGRFPTLPGEVVAVRMDVTASADGLLVPLVQAPWNLFDSVQAGQIVARLDDRAALSLLDAGRKELNRIRAELEAETAKNALDESDRGLSYLREAAQLAAEHQRTLLWLLERNIQVETDRLELQRCEARIGQLKPLHNKDGIPELQWIEENLARDIVAKRLEEGITALSKVEGEEKTLREQREKLPAHVSAEAAKLLAPFQAAIETQQANIRELDLAIDRLIVRAPLDGVICAILRRPGENIRAGDPILTISSPRGQGIVGYLRQDQRMRPLPGMNAEIRLRLPASRAVATCVERVGPQFEPIPPHLCRDPKTPEWGLPIFISLPEGLPARPGELLDVSLLPE